MKYSIGSFKYTLLSAVLVATLAGCGGSSSKSTSPAGSAPEPGSYAVTSTAEVGGDISPSSVTVDEDGTTSFTVSVNPGYSVNNVTGCDGTLTGNAYTTDTITAACDITATFTADTAPNYVVGATAGLNGTISPSSTTVDQGNNALFVISPDEGYTIQDVIGCGGSRSGSIYTTGAVTADCSISASFTVAVASSHTVDTTSSLGGSIAPSSTSLNHGDTTSFTLTIAEGYSVSSVKGCGGTLSGYTFTTGEVLEDCTIIALFNSDAPVEAKSFTQAVADGDAEPVIIEGQEWTFRTPPPPESERTVRATHPRLLLTSDNIPGIRTKLQDPIYSSYISNITSRADAGSMLENAFLYQLTGDVSRAEAAKETLLNYTGDYGERIIYGYDKMSNRFGPILVFDWIMDTLTADEKNLIFANVKDNFNYDHRSADPVNHDGNGTGTYPWYWNDVYNRHPEIYLPALAFTISNEGIDNEWAEEVIAWAYDEDETRVVGPYGANRGSGFLDVLMTMSLDTGGFSDASTQYYNYWMEAVHAVAFWETATGQPMWSRSPWLEKGPQSLLTSREGIHPGSRIMSAIEFVTGQYSGDTASLAKYVTNYYGASEYQVVHRAILGDMRVVEKTPTELGIPTAGYLRGDHVFYSKSSWQNNAVSLYVRSLYLDVGRGVGSEGVFAIDLGDKQLLSPRVMISKTPEHAGYSSGIYIYNPDTPTDFKQNKGTMWGADGERSFDAWTTVSKANHYKAGPESMEINDNYRAISMEYGERYDNFQVNTAQRTMVHIPDGSRNFIVIYDYVDVASNLKSAWQMRLMDEPSINGSEFFITGRMTATVVSPANHTIEWLGGFNNEFVTPSPERTWYTNRKGGSVPGYSVDRPTYIDNFGLGNLYIQPQGQKDSSLGPFIQQSEYLVVLEIGEMTPVTVTRISDREVTFGQWQVKFSPDGSYTVSQI